ncbi:LppU/SCO3897 family protein [Saccharomonospora saliphila]|uniref:LppU/SCO3897 family protein n=1 Tax=Saccharomonospora saliphila TaxID=369829 RepID=UPI00037E6729|nr:hypothetical protein [Saccharomonospora saliphila]
MTVPPYGERPDDSGGAHPFQPPAAPPPGGPNPYGPPEGGLPPYAAYPGSPQAFGQQPFGPDAFGQPPAPPRRKGTAWAGVVAAVALIVAAVVIVIRWSDAGTPELAVGDCVHVSDFSGMTASPELLDCEDDDAVLRVAASEDGVDARCPDGHYSVVFSGQKTLCLMFNVERGDCLTNMDPDSPKGYERVSCADPAAEMVVLRVADGTADPAGACGDLPGRVEPYVYSEPETVICMGPPKAV